MGVRLFPHTLSLDAPESDLYRLDGPILVEKHPVDADFPVVSVCGV